MKEPPLRRLSNSPGCLPFSGVVHFIYPSASTHSQMLLRIVVSAGTTELLGERDLIL